MTLCHSQRVNISSCLLKMIGHCYLPQRNFRQLVKYSSLPPAKHSNHLLKTLGKPNLSLLLLIISPKYRLQICILSMRLLGCWVSIHPDTFRPGKKRQPPIKPRKVLTRNDDAPKPARKKYCYRGSKKPYKFIPETFKDCQLPANEDTVIGTGTFIIFSFPFLFLFSVLFSFSFNS